MSLTEAQEISLSEQGYCVIPGVLDTAGVRDVRERLVCAAAESERRGIPTSYEGLDPNRHNVRVFNLLDLDPVFVELISHPTALALVRHLLSDDFIISNFTANTAKPGSRSMVIHSDLAAVMPEPWLEPWSINVMWCLDDLHDENGATRFLPGSHRIERQAQLPDDLAAQMVPMEAEAGSVIAMDGRVWHTSGENRTRNEERALLFGYYSRSFIRPQWNFNVGLSQATQSALSPELRSRLGLDLAANMAAFQELDSQSSP